MMSKLHSFKKAQSSQGKLGKKQGFTLIELLVVIVIIGLLATISAATFGKYFGKARDAVRTASVSQFVQILKVDSADKWGNEKYIYNLTVDDPANLDDLMDDNDYRLPKADNSICYLIGMGGGDASAGDDNEFFIATWGEETSTANQSVSGVIVDGTSGAVDVISGLTLTQANFTCTESTGPASCAGFDPSLNIEMGASIAETFYCITSTGELGAVTDF